MVANDATSRITVGIPGNANWQGTYIINVVTYVVVAVLLKGCSLCTVI